MLRSQLERSRNLRMWILLDDPSWYDEWGSDSLLADFKEVAYERRDHIHALALRYSKGLSGWPFGELSDPVPNLQYLSIYTGPTTLMVDAPRNMKTKVIRDLELDSCHYAGYQDLIQECVKLQRLSLRECTFFPQPFLPVAVQRVELYGTIDDLYESASIYAQAVVHFEVELLDHDDGTRFTDTALPQFSNLASVRIRLPTEEHITMIVDLLACSPMLQYVEILLDEETMNVGHLYWEFMKRQGWNEPGTLSSSESHSDDTDMSNREPQAPLLRFLRVCVTVTGDNQFGPVVHDVSVLKSLLVLRPLLRTQYVSVQESSMELYNDHAELSKEFPGRIEMIDFEENTIKLPPLADIAAHDSLRDPSR